MTIEEFTHGRVGHGKAVHVFLHKSIMCGSGRSSHMHNFRNPRQRPTTEPVTCKKCLDFMASYEKSKTLG